MAAPFRVVIRPNDDALFQTRVSAALASIDGEPAISRGTMMSLLAQLLPEYPSLEIRQQDRLASFDADPYVWYVFRDGS